MAKVQVLRKRGTNLVFPFSPELAARSDIEVDHMVVKGGGKPRKKNPPTPMGVRAPDISIPEEVMAEGGGATDQAPAKGPAKGKK